MLCRFALLHPICVEDGSLFLSMWWQTMGTYFCRCILKRFWWQCIDIRRGLIKKIGCSFLLLWIDPLWSINFHVRDLTWYVWPMPSRTTSPFASLHPLCVKDGSSTLSIWWQVTSKRLCIRCMWTSFWQLCIDNYLGHKIKLLWMYAPLNWFPYGAMSTRIRQWHSCFVIEHLMTNCGQLVL